MLDPQDFANEASSKTQNSLDIQRIYKLQFTQILDFLVPLLIF